MRLGDLFDLLDAVRAWHVLCKSTLLHRTRPLVPSGGDHTALPEIGADTDNGRFEMNMYRYVHINHLRNV